MVVKCAEHLNLLRCVFCIFTVCVYIFMFIKKKSYTPTTLFDLNSSWKPSQAHDRASQFRWLGFSSTLCQQWSTSGVICWLLVQRFIYCWWVSHRNISSLKLIIHVIHWNYIPAHLMVVYKPFQSDWNQFSLSDSLPLPWWVIVSGRFKELKV